MPCHAATVEVFYASLLPASLPAIITVRPKVCVERSQIHSARICRPRSIPSRIVGDEQTRESFPGMQQQHAIEFFFIEESTSLWGFHWFIEWSTSSIYIKSRHPGPQVAKVSLHGPDPKHPGQQHLRYDLERNKPDLMERAERLGFHWAAGSDPLPFYFSGRPVNDHAAHIVRFSAAWDTFVKGAPGPGSSEGLRQKSTFRALIPAPKKDHVSHVDVYLSLGDPYWPDEEGARALRAGMGPITNAIGMNLTAVFAHRPMTEEPDPYGDVRGNTPLDQCTRGMGAAVDETGLLWLCEKVVPITEFETPESA